MIMLSSLPFEDAGLSLDLVVDAVSIRSISLGDSSFLGGRFCGVLGSWIAPETSFFFSSELDCSMFACSSLMIKWVRSLLLVAVSCRTVLLRSLLSLRCEGSSRARFTVVHCGSHRRVRRRRSTAPYLNGIWNLPGLNLSDAFGKTMGLPPCRHVESVLNLA